MVLSFEMLISADITKSVAWRSDNEKVKGDVEMRNVFIISKSWSN